MGGETHLYLGRQYRLKVSTSAEGSVKLVGRFFHVGVPNAGDTTRIRRMLEQWYDEHARQLFAVRLKALTAGLHALSGVEPPRLQVRPMQRRWGSCSKRGTITLNVDLVQAPLPYVDYVIVHELCHLKVHRHNESFYRLLDRCMPDWRRRKERLDRFTIHHWPQAALNRIESLVGCDASRRRRDARTTTEGVGYPAAADDALWGKG